jgi:hypothetical protein
MDHDEALEALQLAAVEPDGLDRLMAGDTPLAAAVAGHLAGCATCATELERLRRAVPMLRDVVRTTPPADLRDRTLAFVAARGVDRSAAAVAPSLTAIPAAAVSGSIGAPVTTPAAAAAATSRRELGRVLPWVAAIAATVVLSVVASTFVVQSRVDEQLAAQDQKIGALEAVTSGALAVTGEADAARVDLIAMDDSLAGGTLLFSPGTTQLVVVATGLTEPEAGKEYRCWVVVDGERQAVGKMFFSNKLAYWVGDTPAVATLDRGATFGVSLADVDGTSLDAPPVIAGDF